MAAVLDTTWRMRPMLATDLDAVHDIEQAAYDFPWTRGILSDCLRSGYSSWICQARLGELVGYSFLSMGAGEGHILNVCVHPGWRGQGAARHMVSQLLGIADAANLSEVFLEVRPSNKAAIRLYKGFGFRQIARRANYYRAVAGREDALVFSLLMG